jgi:hypothetical protein
VFRGADARRLFHAEELSEACGNDRGLPSVAHGVVRPPGRRGGASSSKRRRRVEAGVEGGEEGVVAGGIASLAKLVRP